MARQDSFAWWLKTGDGQAGGILKRHWRRRDVPIGDGNGTMTVGLFNVWKSARTCSLPLFLLFFLFSSLLRCCVFFRRDDAVVWCVFLSLSLSVVSHVGYRRDWLEAGGEKYFSSLFRASLQLYIFARRGIRCFRLIFAVLDVFGWLFAWSQCARETRRNQTSIVFVATTMSSVV